MLFWILWVAEDAFPWRFFAANPFSFGAAKRVVMYPLALNAIAEELVQASVHAISHDRGSFGFVVKDVHDHAL